MGVSSCAVRWMSESGTSRGTLVGGVSYSAVNKVSESGTYRGTLGGGLLLCS